MQFKFWKGTLLLGIFLSVFAAATTSAQSDDEANGAVQFNFSTPGARSLALGGAFLGSVDDATAAYANPAGLLQISEPEVSVEIRSWDYSTPFADRGRVSGMPTQIGADTISGVEISTAESDASGVSFASFVYPRTKWAVALFYHQVAKFEADFETGGIFTEDGSLQRRLFPIQSTYSLDISHLGLALAGKLSDNFTLGVSVSSYTFELSSLTQRFDGDFFYAPADFPNDFKINFQTQTGDSEEIGYSAGFLWNASEKVSVGGVYRKGPEFDVAVSSSAFSPDVPIPPRFFFEENEPATFNLPDFYGIGFSFKPSQNLTINLDVDQVLYSEMVEDFFVIFDDAFSGPVTPEDFVIDDATEVHLGLEYVFAQIKVPLALRFGAWLDPDHRLRAEAGTELNQVRLFAGDDEIHYAAGIGLVLSSHFQIDAAVDVSDNYDTASVSAVLRF